MQPKRLILLGETFVLLSIIALAAYVRLANVATNPGWYTDEGTDIEIARHLQMGDVQYLAVNQSFLLFGRPPLFQSVLALTFNVFGTGIGTLRGLTGTLGVISVVLLYWVARRGGGRLLGLFAGLMLAIYPNAVIYSRLGFSYNLLTALLLLAFWGMWEYLNNPQKRWIALAAIAIGIGGLSNLASFNFVAPLIVVTLFRHKRDLLWVLPLAVLPFLLYSVISLLTVTDAFLFDTQFTFLRLGKFSFLEQISLTSMNFISLVQHDYWVGVGIVGLFIIPLRRLRNLTILMLMLPLLALGRTVILSSTGYYYFIPLLPLIALGMAAVVKYGAPYVFGIVRDGLANLLNALPLPESASSRWLQTRFVVFGTSFAVFYFFIAPFIAILFFHVVSYIPTVYPTQIDSYLLNPMNARQAVDFVNNSTQPDDVVLASPGLAWGINTHVADFQMMVAYTHVATEHLPDNIPTDRWVFDVTYTRARFAIVDNLWTNWAVNEMDEVQVITEDIVIRWQLVFEAGDIRVYENPNYRIP